MTALPVTQRHYVDDDLFARFERTMARATKSALDALPYSDKFYSPWVKDQRNRLRLFGRSTWLSDNDMAVVAELEWHFDQAAQAAKA
jgi:hypothetical protein